MKTSILTRRGLLGATTAAAGALVLPSTRARAFLVASSGRKGHSPITDITLDNTIFTGSDLGTGSALIGQIRTVPDVTADWSVGGADGSLFKVVTNSLWQKTNRADPTLQTVGAITGRAAGFSISVTATPSGGGTPFAKPFTLGLPSIPADQGTVRTVDPPSSSSALQTIINGAAEGDTIFFNPGTYKLTTAVVPRAGQLYKCDTGANRATIEGPDGDVIYFGRYPDTIDRCKFYGLAFHRVVPTANNSSGWTFTNCSFNNDNINNQDIGQGACVFLTSPSNFVFEFCSFRDANSGIRMYSPDNTTVTRCTFINITQCFGISPGAGTTQGRNIRATKNYLRGMKRMGFEFHPESGTGYMTNMLVADNFIENWGSPIYSDGNSLGLSIVPSTGTGNQILRNYVKAGPNLNTSPHGPGTIGHGYGIEFNSDAPVTVSDNYINGLGVSPGYLFDAAIYGPYVNVAHILSNNNNINCNDAYGGGGGTQMGFAPNAIVIGTTHIDLGTPSPFAAGAGP